MASAAEPRQARIETSEVTIRNSRAMSALLLACALGSFFVAACSAIMFLAGCFAFAWSRLSGMAAEAASLCATAATGIWLWRLGVTRARGQVRLTADGVSFRFGRSSKTQKTEETFLAWGDIRQVICHRLRNSRSYAVVGASQRVTYSWISFGRPRHLASLIAARAGKSLTETR